MIKRGLMTQFPCARGRAFVCKNIGDYVQAVATRQYVNPINEYVEQEEANFYFPEDKQKIKLIMNGWFQWRAENWPPSEYIEPLLISMHISPVRADALLTEEGIKFLKKHSPVGCRDFYTKNLLESKGIPAYFSACQTLTLGHTYKVDDSERSGVCIVDPYFEIPDLYEEKDGIMTINNDLASEVFEYYLKHKDVIDKLSENEFFKVYSPIGFLDRDESKYRAIYKATMFYKTYSQKFDDELLIDAEYITHWVDVDMSGNVTNDDLLDLADSLVKKYAKSELVITSRIHAGLPCLGLDTPVVFIANEEVVSATGTFNTPGRLDGLIEFFRVLNLEDGVFSTTDEEFKNIDVFSKNTKFVNKQEWRPYADELYKKSTEFMMG